jgi:hypothetical protein
MAEHKYKSCKERYSDPEYKKQFLEKYNIPIVCECGTHIKSKLNLSHHLKSKKHFYLMKIIELTSNAEQKIN